MKRILFHGLSWGWLLFVISLVLLAISITLLRVAAPMVADYRAEIETQISKMLDRPVEIESIEFSVQGFRPVVEVNGVRVLSRIERKTIFDFERMTLAVNPWRSLLKGSLIPSDIMLSGSHLSFVRRLDGGITVSGFQLGAGGRAPGERLDLLTNLTFQLRDIEVHWEDYPLGTTYRFASKIMQVRVTPASIDLQGEIQLPEGMGKNVDITLNIQGPVTNYLAWDGEFFIDAALLDLPRLPLEFTDKLPIIEKGTASLRVWGGWQGQHLKQATGDLGLKEVLMRPLTSEAGKIPPLFRLDSLQTRFNAYQIHQGWQIDTDQLRITSQENRWPQSSLSVSLQKFADQWLMRGSTAYLDISTLTSLFSIALNDQTELAKRLQQADPSGGIYNLLFSRWSTRPDTEKTYAASGEFSAVSWNAWKSVPGLDGLDGTFDLDQDDGKILLSGQGLGVSIPNLFQHSLWIDSLYSELSWQLKENGLWDISASNFELQNQDVQMRGEAELQIGAEDGIPNLKLTASFPEFQIEKARDYLPLKIMPEKTGKWLTRALVAGQASDASFSYDGPLSKTAFKNGTAVMLANFDAVNAELDYKKDWPVITGIAGKVAFKNASMTLAADAATVYDNQVKKATAEIANFFRPELKLDLDVEGPLTGALKYLRGIPVSRGMEGVMDAADSAGEVDLALKLDIPLSKKLNKKTSVDGRLDFNNNELSFPENEIVVSNIKGTLDFTESSYTAENISGIFRGSAVDIDVNTLKGKAVDIDVTGLFSVDQLLPGNRLLPEIALGRSRWDATIKVPPKKQRLEKKPVSLHVTSRLKGTRIALPAPLGKISLVERDFILDMPLGRGQPVITFDYAPVLFGKLKLKGKGRKAAIERAVVSLSEQTLKLPDTGIDIIGHWPLLDTKGWQKRFSELAKPVGGASLGSQVQRVSVSISEWIIAGQQFSNVQLTAARNSHFWRANIDGDTVSGFLRLPQKNLPGSVFEAELEKLYLKKSTAVGEAISPRDLPALKVSVDDFHWQDASLGQLELNTEKDLWGMQINQLRLSSDELSAQATGQWRQDDQGQQQTKLEFRIQGDNLGKTLSELEISKTMTGGKGNLQGSIHWNDAPYKLAFSSWNGDVTVSVEEGRLSQVNPGFGRVLGLLNVEQLPKRLALQFDDVSGQGFEFSKLDGQVSLVDGEAYMQNFRIDSPAADMVLSGSINLPQHIYNLTLGVTPKLTGTAPLAAGIIAGPQAGAVVYLVDKLASSVGVNINKAIEQEYRITGKWEEPQVELTSPDTTEGDSFLPSE